jgi:hypothetical protein
MPTMCSAWRDSNQSLPEGVAKFLDRSIRKLIGKERKDTYPDGIDGP